MRMDDENKANTDKKYRWHRKGKLERIVIPLTEQQARDLLKDDFDKFKKVECE